MYDRWSSSETVTKPKKSKKLKAYLQIFLRNNLDQKSLYIEIKQSKLVEATFSYNFSLTDNGILVKIDKEKERESFITK